MSRNTTRDRAIDAAFYLAKKNGLYNLTRERIAAQARISTGSVTNAAGGIDKLRDEVVKRALKEGEAAILIAAVGARHPLVAGLDVRTLLKKLAVA